MPDTRPNIVFNEDGVCDACISSEKKEQGIDWEARKNELEKIFARYRSDDSSKYDCIVPVSGGKDSHFQTWVVKHEFNMNPLAVTFAHCSRTPLGDHNLQSLRQIGVDHILFTPDPIVYGKLAREGLLRFGDSCWPCHAGIFTLPVQIAVKFDISLIVWGENVQMEYGGPASRRENQFLDRKWLEEFGLSGNTVDEMVSDEIPIPDLKPYIYPSDEEIQRIGVTGIFLGYYLKWDARKQTEFIRKHTDFKVKEDGPCVGTYTNYENLDGKFVGFHDWLMYLKFGFGRATSHACIDIRNGRMTRDEAIDVVNSHEGSFPEEYYNEFLPFLNINEKEFNEVCNKFVNKRIFERDMNGRWVKKEAMKLKHEKKNDG